MTFDLDHWRNPRATIATRLQANDLAYATHGAMQVGVALRKLGYLPGVGDTLLDYGCGTGRIGRCATTLWRAVVGYDPVPECIEEGLQEAQPLLVPNLLLTSNWAAVPEVDHAICVSVMEHLTLDAQLVMLGHLVEKVRGSTVIWYRPATNGAALIGWLNPQERHEDAVNPTGIQVRAFNLRT